MRILPTQTLQTRSLPTRTLSIRCPPKWEPAVGIPEETPGELVETPSDRVNSWINLLIPRPMTDTLVGG